MIRLCEEYGRYTFEDHIRAYMARYFEDSINNGSDPPKSFPANELAWEMTMEENNEGTIYVATQDNIDFITCYWHEAQRAEQYVKENFDLTRDIFDEPEKVVFDMYLMGCMKAVNNSDYINEHWDDEIVLDKETINTLRKELGITDKSINLLYDTYDYDI